MSQTRDPQKAAIFAAIVFVLFGTYVSYALFLSGQPESFPLVKYIAAKDGEDGGSEDSGDDEDENQSENEDEDNDEDEDEDENEVSETSEEKAEREAAKESAKKAQEAAKKRASLTNGAALQSGVGGADQELSETAETSESATEESEDNSGKDQGELIKHLNEKLAESEKEILEKQSEGVNVTAALAALMLAKDKAAGIDALLSSGDLEQLKALAKEVERLAHTASGKVLHIAKESAKDIAKVDKRIAQTKEKIAALENAGGDGNVYTDRLNALETEWTALKATVASTNGDVAVLVSIETMERRVKALKNAVEGALLALGVTDDDEFESEHVAEIEDASDDLADLAEIEDDDSDLKRLATVHHQDAERAAELVEKFESRSLGMRQLFGDDRESLASLESVIVANEVRIQAMETVIATVSDQEVATLMTAKITDLKEENVRLQNFVNSQPTTSGLFGWVFNWF